MCSLFQHNQIPSTHGLAYAAKYLYTWAVGHAFVGFCPSWWSIRLKFGRREDIYIPLRLPCESCFGVGSVMFHELRLWSFLWIPFEVTRSSHAIVMCTSVLPPCCWSKVGPCWALNAWPEFKLSIEQSSGVLRSDDDALVSCNFTVMQGG